MPVVFLSYSHDSETHCEQVVALAQRLRTDGFDARLDRFLPGGPAEGLQRWMLDQLDEADFVLLICTETYYRRFRGHEAEDKGYGVDWEGSLITLEVYHARSRTLKFVPVIFSERDALYIPEPLRGLNHYFLTSEDSYLSLHDFLAGGAGVDPAPIGSLKIRPKKAIEPLTFGTTAAAAIWVLAPSRLPLTRCQLFGRDADLARLTKMWNEGQVNVMALVAWGGVGKTSLVGQWEANLTTRSDFDGDYFDWSFFSQGTRDHSAASADLFIDSALRHFGAEELASSASAGWEKGSRLAEILARRRALLVLDGLEPLQHGQGQQEGALKDPAMQALLRGLAVKNAGLCIITSRVKIADLSRWQGNTFVESKLDRLESAASVALLQNLGVDGSLPELKELVEDVKGHALTLNLLGLFLKEVHGGNVRKRDLVALGEADEELQGGHAFRVIEAYVRFFEAEGEKGRRQLAILRLIGLFNRPASPGCLGSLREKPVISGLTEPLRPLNETQWRVSLNRLVACDLIEDRNGTLDAHPLIRAFFADQLRTNNLGAWRVANGRIFDYLKGSTEYQPITLPSLQPLYQAVFHACQANRHPEACEVYWDRIHRGREAFSRNKLGAFGADLGAVACFFEKPWNELTPLLDEKLTSWLLNEAALSLRALGRLQEASEPMFKSMAMDVKREDWRGAAISASNLSELELVLGNVKAAVEIAEKSVLLADRSAESPWQMGNRATLADATHQAGELQLALTLFREAERIQVERQPQYPLLYSLSGFWYCDLLLSGAERKAGCNRDGLEQSFEHCDEVHRRAVETLVWANQHLGLLDVALDHLTRGRALLYRSILNGGWSQSPENSRAEIEKAVVGLHSAGAAHFIPRGLLTRAWLRCVDGNQDGARADLDDAQEIAERGSMKLHLADVALHRARLFRDWNALYQAKRLVTECGYGRRLPEIADLEEIFASGRLLPWHPGAR